MGRLLADVRWRTIFSDINDRFVSENHDGDKQGYLKGCDLWLVAKYALAKSSPKRPMQSVATGRATRRDSHSGMAAVVARDVQARTALRTMVRPGDIRMVAFRANHLRFAGFFDFFCFGHSRGRT